MNKKKCGNIEIDFSNISKIENQLLAKQWNEQHTSTISKTDMRSIYAAPPKPAHPNRAPNQLTKNSPKPNHATMSKPKVIDEQKIERARIQKSKSHRKKHRQKQAHIHFVSGGLGK